MYRWFRRIFSTLEQNRPLPPVISIKPTDTETYREFIDRKKLLKSIASIKEMIECVNGQSSIGTDTIFWQEKLDEINFIEKKVKDILDEQ